AGNLERSVVLAGFLAHAPRRHRVIVVEGERPLHQAPARPRGRGALLSEPVTGRVHEQLGCLTGIRQRFKQADMAETLLPMSVVVVVYHGDGTCHDTTPRAGEQRAKLSAPREWALVGQH